MSTDINTLIEKIKALPDGINIFGDALTHKLGPVADLKALVSQFESATELVSIMERAVHTLKSHNTELYCGLQEAIALVALAKWPHVWASENGKERLEACRQILETSGSKAEGQSSPWVAVSDRLPEVGVRVLVMRNSGFVDTDKLLRNKDLTGHGWAVASGRPVVAWMPIPPFTPSEDTGENEKI